jgi:hypothetical protein
MIDGGTLKGREGELASLQRVLDANGPRVAFVYGVAGIGKSALLNAFASGVRGSGTQVWRIDCAAIDPTESSFRAALDAAGWQPGSAGVVLVDTYEMFRIADPWLRHELVPSLSTEPVSSSPGATLRCSNGRPRGVEWAGSRSSRSSG